MRLFLIMATRRKRSSPHVSAGTFNLSIVIENNTVVKTSISYADRFFFGDVRRAKPSRVCCRGSPPFVNMSFIVHIAVRGAYTSPPSGSSSFISWTASVKGR